MARAFRAFVRAKKVKTAEQLLREVFLDCGLDKPLREVAGTFTVLYESITDQAVAERLRACGPWEQAMRGGCCRCLQWTHCPQDSALWSLTPAVFKPQALQEQTIVFISRWICCPAVCRGLGH